MDSEQLLTYAYPPKNASKYPQKTFLDTLRTLEALYKATKYFFNQIKASYSYHKYGIGIYIVSNSYRGDVFGETQKNWRHFVPPPLAI